MTNFKVGQKVVCIETVDWFNEKSSVAPIRAPKKNDVCTIVHISSNNNYLEFEEYPPHLGNGQEFDPRYFRPINYNDATQEILTNFQPSEDRVDLPVKEKVYT